jgi:hypothetical protein
MQRQRSKPQPSLVRACEHCGAPFRAEAGKIRRGHGRFCSRGCVQAARPTAAERFWASVRRAENGCLLWTGSLINTGYGTFSVNDRDMLIHRFSWELHHGPIPPGMEVCHSCDAGYPADDTTYRRCGEPSHLFLADHDGNMKWASATRRMAHGERHGTRTVPERVARGERSGGAKLTEADVRAIRAASTSEGYDSRELAARYGVRMRTIQEIVRRSTWAHI